MEYVILDIETTGLDPEFSSIIEIAAVVVSGGKIRNEFTSFVRYEDEVPTNIVKLTGISSEDVRNAPVLSDVLNALRTFIGKRPVVSHNGFSFDFRMLARNGFPIEEKYDSLELAFFVLPTNAAGHSTKALSEYFGLGQIKHRALEDCKAEHQIIEKLLREFGSRPKEQTEALKAIGERAGWWWAQLLTVGTAFVPHVSTLVSPHVPYRKPQSQQEQMAFKDTKKIDIEKVKSLFSPKGQYAESRPEQLHMAATIADNLNTHTHSVIEAGTGVGKSKAYLVPSVLFALENQIPIIISTFTKALQDQLFFKEIPHLREITNKDLRVAVVKGKHNYVCLQKFDEFLDETLETIPTRSLYRFEQEGVKFTARLTATLLAAWLVRTDRGDWDELPYWLTDRIGKDIEQEVCNTDEMCASGTCDFFDEERCFLAKARARARDADLVIANHAVVLSGILPRTDEEKDVVDEEAEPGEAERTHAVFPNEAKFLVLDEAHHLEEAATSAWSEVVSHSALQRLLQRMYGKKGVDNRLFTIAERKGNARLSELAANFKGLEQDTKLAISNLFNDIIPAVMPTRTDASTNNWSEFLSFKEIGMTSEHLKVMADSLGNITGRLKQMSDILRAFCDDEDEPRAKKILGIRARQALQIALSIEIISDDGPAYVRYIERRRGVVEIKADLLSVAETLKEDVYDNFSSVILTSATITIGNTFNFFDERCGTGLLGGDELEHHLFASSFDYKKQVQFLVPEGITYSGSGEAQRVHYELSKSLAEEGIVAAGGGALILCSSHKQVGSLYNDLVRPFAKKGLYLLRQTQGKSVGSVVREFAEDTHSVLVGTRSLWQGVDVPGPSLRALFIFKLPYLAPGNPVMEARQQALDDAGRSGFADYYEPLAVLTLKQGFGRLIRKATDTGVVVMTDERILRKRAFLTSFPEGVQVKKADRATVLAALSALYPSE